MHERNETFSFARGKHRNHRGGKNFEIYKWSMVAGYTSLLLKSALFGMLWPRSFWSNMVKPCQNLKFGWVQTHFPVHIIRVFFNHT